MTSLVLNNWTLDAALGLRCVKMLTSFKSDFLETKLHLLNDYNKQVTCNFKYRVAVISVDETYHLSFVSSSFVGASGRLCIVSASSSG